MDHHSFRSNYASGKACCATTLCWVPPAMAWSLCRVRPAAFSMMIGYEFDKWTHCLWTTMAWPHLQRSQRLEPNFQLWHLRLPGPHCVSSTWCQSKLAPGHRQSDEGDTSACDTSACLWNNHGFSVVWQVPLKPCAALYEQRQPTMLAQIQKYYILRIDMVMFCGIVASLKLPMPFHGLQGEMVVSLECNCDQSKLCRQTATCGRVDQLPVFLN